MSHRHPSAVPRWRRASRVPSATASQPTLSPSQQSSSRRSAAARSVGSMRSRGPGTSPSRDRASSYVGPPFLKCATVSRVARLPEGATGPWLRHIPMCVSPWLGACERRGARCGGGGVLGGARRHRLSTQHGAPGPPAASPWSPRPEGAQGPPCESPWAPAGCVAPTPRVGWRRTAVWEFPLRALSRTTGLHSRAESAPTLCASHAVMELFLMIHGAKSVPRRCFGKPSDRSR